MTPDLAQFLLGAARGEELSHDGAGHPSAWRAPLQ
jgi:hypothetical protein